MEYAKAAPAHILPTLWFRNTWAWDHNSKRPRLARAAPSAEKVIVAAHSQMDGTYRLVCEGEPELLFTGNDSNAERLYGAPSASPYVKDAFGEYLIRGRTDAVNPLEEGTKAAAH